MRSAWFVLAVAAAIAVAAYVTKFATFDDFRAFYCAGAVARSAADPYRAQPIHRCELAAMPAALQTHWRDVVIPAPLPPYAAAFFEPVSLIPFGAAAFLWALASITAVAVLVLALRDMTHLSSAGIVLAVALPVFGASIMLGQIVPVVAAAVCLCAWFLSRDNLTGAAIAAAFAFLDPRAGAAVFLSLALWVPGIRARLLVVLAALGAMSLAVGAHTNIEYYTAVLAAHGLSEAASFEQYSLTAILYAFGFPLAAAAAAGTASFIVMVGAGILAGRAASARLKDPAFLVLVPAAFAVAGGPFMHLTQIALAIPALLLLISKTERYRGAALAALVLLALPWPMAKSAAFVYMAPLLTFAMLWWLNERRGYLVPFYFAAATAILSLSLHYGYTRETQGPHVAIRQTGEPRIPSYLAEATWSHLMWTENSNDDALSWAKRIPTLAGLLLLLALAVDAQKERVPMAAPSSIDRNATPVLLQQKKC